MKAKLRPRLTWSDVAAAVVLCAGLGAIGAFSTNTGYFGADEVSTPSALENSLYYVAYVCAALLLFRNRDILIVTLKRAGLLFSFIAICFLSAIWSVAPLATLSAIPRLLLFFALGGALATERRDVVSLCNLIGVVLTGLLTVSLVGMLLKPAYFLTRESFELHGVFVHKNHMGFLAACTAAIVLLSDRALLVKLVAIAIAAACAVYARSGTGLLCFAIVFIAVAVLHALAKAPPRLRSGAYVAVATCLLLIGIFAVTHPDRLLDALGKDATLTGRTKVWEVSAQLIWENPIVGYGYAVLGQNSFIGSKLQVFGSIFTHPHDAWLNTGLQLGLVGIFVQAAIYLNVLSRGVVTYLRNPSERSGQMLIVLGTLFLIRTIPESDWGNARSAVTFLIVALSACETLPQAALAYQGLSRKSVQRPKPSPTRRRKPQLAGTGGRLGPTSAYKGRPTSKRAPPQPTQRL